MALALRSVFILPSGRPLVARVPSAPEADGNFCGLNTGLRRAGCLGWQHSLPTPFPVRTPHRGVHSCRAPGPSSAPAPAGPEQGGQDPLPEPGRGCGMRAGGLLLRDNFSNGGGVGAPLTSGSSCRRWEAVCRPGEPCVGPVPLGPAPENARPPGWSSGRPSLLLRRSSPSRRDLGLLGRTGGCAELQNRSPGARGAGRQDIWGAVPPSRGRGKWKRPVG